MKRRKELIFKTYPYFWQLSKNGQKPFDFRLYDPDDKRFQALEDDWRQCSICLINTDTGERFCRPVTGYEHAKPFMGNWVIIHFQNKKGGNHA